MDNHLSNSKGMLVWGENLVDGKIRKEGDGKYGFSIVWFTRKSGRKTGGPCIFHLGLPKSYLAKVIESFSF